MAEFDRPNRILIFELNWMGDILFSYPFLRAIRQKLPEAYIACVVVPRYADLLINNPWVNDVHVLSDNNSIMSLGEKINFANMIRKETYDTCFMLKPSRTKALMAGLAGVRRRIGFSGKNDPLTDEVEAVPGVHRADQILTLASAVGVTSADGSYEYFLNGVDEERADEILRGKMAGTRRMVAINPGGNWDAKRWPAENFIKLAQRITDMFDDVEIMVTGAKKDIPLGARIASEVGHDKCYSVAGQTGINDLAALFKRCALVVSADSGPLHLASAVGATTIGLYGPTSRDLTGPRGKGKNIVLSKDVRCEIPCYVEKCEKEYICMRAISVDEVFDTAEKELAAQ